MNWILSLDSNERNCRKNLILCEAGVSVFVFWVRSHRLVERKYEEKN